jgi:hypothetical protein
MLHRTADPNQIEEYNLRRPHRGLGMKAPRHFAEECTKGRA